MTSVLFPIDLLSVKMCNTPGLANLSLILDKLWFCRLSPNHKVLHYGDFEDNIDNPPIEMLASKSEFISTISMMADGV